ncbi:hypothetical protein LIER_30595 [Lithospermum erythrorhizon]|uniref:Ubiquitin-like protease family profile domain-containing protein n=1 Tax=Lithospermum erythrorhizon TaxID=34254 RepID=A0AAV3RRX2_LITER
MHCRGLRMTEHWSLLVYDRKLNEFLHHDSSRGGANSIQAKKLCDALKDSVTSNSADPSVSTCPTFQECVTPEQTNGLFVWAIARAIRECIAARRNRSSNIGLKKNK